MKRLDFNKGWEVRCVTTDSAYKAVSIPHDAMISEPRIAESIGEGNIGFFAGYDYEYRKVKCESTVRCTEDHQGELK